MSKRFEDPNLEDISNQMLPGAIALIILLFFYVFKSNLNDYFVWLIQQAISFIIAVLFIRIVTNTIVNRHFNPENAKFLIVGTLLFIPYYLYTNMTPDAVLLIFLEATILVSFYEIIVNMVKEAID